MNVIEKIKSTVPASLLIATTVCIYTPSLIYFENRKYFSLYFEDLISDLINFSMLGFLFCFVIFWLVSFFQHLVVPILVLSLLLWLQANFFTISYGVLDGSNIDFNLFNYRGSIEIIIIIVAFICGWLFRKKLKEHIAFILILMTFGQLGLTTYRTVTEKKDKAPIVEIDQEYFNYSRDKNIIVVVLDTFGSEYFQKIIEERPEITDNFNGFVSYTDAISNYPATKASIPSMLTGKMLEEDQSYDSFMKGASENGFLQKLNEKGYLASVVGMASRFREIYPDRYIFLPSLETKKLSNHIARTLTDLSIFRAIPHYLKPVIYNNGDWLFSQKNSKTDVPEKNPEKTLYMFDMVTSRAKVNGETPRVKFYHFRLPHPHFVLDSECHRIRVEDYKKHDRPKEQSICAIKKLTQFLNKLKELGVYNNSLIVVTSDHGARVFSDYENTGFPSYFEIKTSGILFMIKGINQQQSFSQIKEPISLDLLHDVILNESLHSTKLNQLKAEERVFYSYKNGFNKSKDRIHAGALYRVLPGADQLENWELLGFHTHSCKKQKIPLLVNFTSKHPEKSCANFNFLEPSDDGSGSFMEGVDARVIVSIDASNLKQQEFVVFEATFSVPELISKNSNRVQWYINDKLMFESQINLNKVQKHRFKIPVSTISNKQKTEVKIYLPDVKYAKNSTSKNKGLFIRQMRFNLDK